MQNKSIYAIVLVEKYNIKLNKNDQPLILCPASSVGRARDS